MCLKREEPSSGNLIAQEGSFQNCTKTNHDSIYNGKIINYLVVNRAHGSNIRRIHERNILR